MYTIPQILAAAKKAEVSEIDAQHICDTLVKMNQHAEIGTFRKVIEDDFPFIENEIVKILEVDASSLSVKYMVTNINGEEDWLYDHTHEPTTETF